MYFFREGAPLFGKLPFSHNGPPKEYTTHESIEELKQNAASSNSKILMRLKEDDHSDTLLKQVVGCMSLGGTIMC